MIETSYCSQARTRLHSKNEEKGRREGVSVLGEGGWGQTSGRSKTNEKKKSGKRRKEEKKKIAKKKE